MTRRADGQVFQLLGQAVDGVFGLGLSGLLAGDEGRRVADVLKLQVVQGSLGDDEGLVHRVQILLRYGAFIL